MGWQGDGDTGAVAVPRAQGTHTWTCEEFEGRCCRILSDHPESTHKSIQQLKEGVWKMRVDDGIWLENLFDKWNLTSWMKELLKMGLYVLIIIK